MAKQQTPVTPAAPEQQTPETTASPEQKPDTAKPKYRITAPAKGFRRAGRLWQGVTEVPDGALTAEQVAQIKAEPRLTIEEV